MRDFFTLVRVTSFPGSLSAAANSHGGGGGGEIGGDARTTHLTQPPAAAGVVAQYAAAAAAAAPGGTAPKAQAHAAAGAEAGGGSAATGAESAAVSEQPNAASARRQMAGRTPDDHMRFSSYSFAITEQVTAGQALASAPSHWHESRGNTEKSSADKRCTGHDLRLQNSSSRTRRVST